MSKKTRDPYLALGERFEMLREQRGWTMKQLCGRADMSYETYESIREGNPPTLRTCKRLADALGIRLGELFDGI